MIQQTLFDEPAGPSTDRVPPAEQHHDASASEVAEQMRRKDRAESREKERLNDMHAKVMIGANKVAILRWVLTADDSFARLDDQTAYREAQRCKGRMDAFQAALDEDRPDDHLTAEAWPYDDDPDTIPTIYTDALDYEGYLASVWCRRWRHVIPTDVVEEAKTERPSFL